MMRLKHHRGRSHSSSWIFKENPVNCGDCKLGSVQDATGSVRGAQRTPVHAAAGGPFR